MVIRSPVFMASDVAGIVDDVEVAADDYSSENYAAFIKAVIAALQDKIS